MGRVVGHNGSLLMRLGTRNPELRALRLASLAQGTIRLVLTLLACHERAERVEWWRRRESNPRPKRFELELLHA